jgi:hypothetical protein
LNQLHDFASTHSFTQTFTQRTALQEALSAAVLTLSSIAVALLHLRKPGKLRNFKQVSPDVFEPVAFILGFIESQMSTIIKYL